MADTPKKVIRLIDNIKLEIYEEGKKKYAKIWEPTGNNTYNEGDGGPSGIKSPERSKKLSTGESDDAVIHLAIENSQIVEYYRLAAKRTKEEKDEDIKPYFTYLQDPFSETPPPKRVYGGGGLGTPEVDNVGPTPYYLNNGCKVNIKWTGRVPNPDFDLGSFSTPSEAERYNKYLKPEGPPRFLEDKPILSDEDESSDGNTTLRPQSKWVLETGGYDPGDDNDTTNPLKINSDSFTYSVNFRDKPEVKDKFVSITLPTGFAENGGKGYLEWVGKGADEGLIYSTAPKGTISVFRGSVNSRGEGVGEAVDIKVKNHFNVGAHSFQKDENILKSIIEAYKKQVGKVYIIDYKDYDLKVCFPDTGTCSQIPYKSPIVDLSGVIVTPSGGGVVVVGATPSLIPKKVKLNVFGLPGVTSLSGETDGTIKVKVKVSLPDFTVYLGDPPGATNSDASGLNPFGLVEDDVENPDPYEESAFTGTEEGVGENLVTPVEFQENIKQAEDDAKRVDGGGGGGGKKIENDNVKHSNYGKVPPPPPISKGSFSTTGIAPNTPLPPSPTIPAGFNGVPLYSQYDTRWGSSMFDWMPGGARCMEKNKKTGILELDNSTVATSGCGPSAVSMVINFWASKGRCKPTRPDIVAKFFADYGGRVCGSGSGLGNVKTEKFKEAFGIVLKYGVTEAQIVAALKKGYPCVIAGSSFRGYNYAGKKIGPSYIHGHFLCLTGIDTDGRVRVNDSGNNPSAGRAITSLIGTIDESASSISQRAIIYPVGLSSPA